jgi:hypothetical protein
MKSSILVAAEAPNVYIAARLYAAMGLSVLPCTGKKPALSNWTHLQHRIALPVTIDLWQKTGLLSNVGIICGDVSDGLVVVDLDGQAAIDAFRITFPDLLDTYSVRSGSGEGLHLYYVSRVVPPTTRVTGLDMGNIELRANGAYVIAPPSVHPESKKPYTISNPQAILLLPDLHEVVNWIKALIREKHGGTMLPVANKSLVINPTAYGAVSLRNAAVEVARALPGERNHTLYRMALKMGSLVADGKISAAQVERELLAAAGALTQSDGEAATRRTIRSGLHTGMQSARSAWEKRDEHGV